jgi:hypothetical protein
MRYVDELVRNVIAEIRLWARRRAVRRQAGPFGDSVASPLVAGMTRPVAARHGRRSARQD